MKKIQSNVEVANIANIKENLFPKSIEDKTEYMGRVTRERMKKEHLVTEKTKKKECNSYPRSEESGLGPSSDVLFNTRVETTLYRCPRLHVSSLAKMTWAL